MSMRSLSLFMGKSEKNASKVKTLKTALPPENRSNNSRSIFWWIITAYFLTRFFSLAYYAVHNDEVNYIQFSQLMHADWNKHWSLSMDGRTLGSYKDPLQFWIGSLFVDFFANPAIGTRLCSVFFGLVNLIFVYLLAKKISSRTLLAEFLAAMIVLSDCYTMFDSIFMMEVYVYGLGAVYLYLIVCLVETFWMTGKLDYKLTLSASLNLFLIFLTKQSAPVWILFSCLMTLIFLASRDWLTISHLRRLLSTAVCVAIPSIFGRLIYNFVIPAKFAMVRDNNPEYYNPANFLKKQPFQWIQIWDGISFYARILFVEFHWLWIIPIATFLFYFLVRKIEVNKKLLLMLLFGAAVSFLPGALFIKNYFVRYYAASILFAFLLVAYLLASIYKQSKTGQKIALGFLLGLFLLKIFTSYVPLWKYKATDMSILETPPSQAAWAHGIGIEEMLEKISKLPDGLLFFDPQWGLPGTAIQIFYKRYPHLMCHPINYAVAGTKDTTSLRALLPPSGKDKNIYFVFDSNVRPGREFVPMLLQNQNFCGKRDVIEKKYRNKIFENSSIVFCKAS